jgi:hypothetical protein
MAALEVLKEENGKIISLKRLSDNVVFSLGDCVDLNFNVEKCIFEGYTIKEFQNEKGGNKHFPNSIFNKGAIITKFGVIELGNASHVDLTSEKYLLLNTPYLTIAEVVKLLGEKHLKRLTKLVKSKNER